MPRVVTLTTDFGAGSGYVAELKGRLLHAATPFTLVDIAHDLPAHDIRSAAWLVDRGCFAFPTGSLHIVVVDPGVGTGRRLIWARIAGQEFLCPDNGVLTLALRRHATAIAREIVVESDAAATFHGRDVLAPLAARLVDGMPGESSGPPLDALTRLAWPEPRETEAGLVGEVIHVDAFGNLVTNLPDRLLPRLLAAGGMRVGTHGITRIVRTYGDAPPGTAVTLVGSQGFIEAAVVEGRADTLLGAGLGTCVTLAGPRA